MTTPTLHYFGTLPLTEYKVCIGSLPGVGRISDEIALLGRCKNCRTGVKLPRAERCYVSVTAGGYTVSGYRITDAEGAQTLVRSRTGSWHDGVLVACPKCHPEGPPEVRGWWIKVVPVMGKVNHSKVCDGRCMSATGPNCECACGGKNHGGNHAC